MKKTILAILGLFTNILSFSQVNEELIKTSNAYVNAVSALEVGLVDPDFFDQAASLYPNVSYLAGSQKAVYAAIINCSAKGNYSLVTTIIIKINNGLSISIAFDPHGDKGSKYVEAAIMQASNGEVVEIDYGYVTKERVPNDQNLFLERLTLKNGSNVIIQNKFWIVGFNIAGDKQDGRFIVPPYPIE